MSRTQDLVLARLRLIAMRWQGGWEAGAEQALVGEAGAEQAREGEPDSGERAKREPALPGGRARVEPGHVGDGDAGLLGRTGSVGALGEAAWRSPIPWLRLMALLLLVVSLAGAALTFVARPREQPDGTAAAQITPGETDLFVDPFPSASPSTSVPLLVHVVGEVRHPGVVRLPAGSRVVDAVEEAGGLRRGGKLGSTNLARVLVDGERIEVGTVEGPGPGGSASGGGASSGPLDLNIATAEQLDTLPGIGPVTAAKILSWRTTNGRFTTVDELAEVPGIGPKTLAELRPHVRV